MIPTENVSIIWYYVRNIKPFLVKCKEIFYYWKLQKYEEINLTHPNYISEYEKITIIKSEFKSRVYRAATIQVEINHFKDRP